MVAYLFDYNRAKREGNEDFVFVLPSMVINMIMGGFVAYLVGTGLDTDVAYRDIIVGISGVTAYNILLLASEIDLEAIVYKVFGKYIKKKKD